ncbi:hypothetical protein JCM3770_000973 [Rhodotorula araucariae]
MSPPHSPIASNQDPAVTATAPKPAVLSTGSVLRRPGPVLSGDARPPSTGPAVTKMPVVPVARVAAAVLPADATTAMDDRDYSLPDRFSHCALHPPLSGLRFDYYRPYLHNQPISPAWSSLYCETFIRFALSIAPPQLWSNKPGRLFVVDEAPRIVHEIRSYEPNRELFRRNAPLHRSKAGHFVSSDVLTKLVAMRDVMRWIWEYDGIDVDEVAGMVLTAPLAVHMIIRTLASSGRYTNVRRICEEELMRYLLHASAPTARERDARTLVRWLAAAGADPVRRYRFLIDRAGRARTGPRGEPGWEWWFADGGNRSAQELDVWEEEVRRKEGWA